MAHKSEMPFRKQKHFRKQKSWKDLPPKARIGTLIAAAVQLSLLIAAQLDISRRPTEQIRGSKALWRAATLVNFIGPSSYFAFGRKRLPSRETAASSPPDSPTRLRAGGR
jgi:hypothetical protein